MSAAEQTRRAAGWAMLRATAACLAAAASTAAGAEAPEPVPAWHRQGAGWIMSGKHVSRAEAVRRLAAASGTELSVAPGALDGMRPVRGGVRAGSLADAWTRLLSAHGSHAVQCTGTGRCRVWLLVAGPAPDTRAPSPMPAQPVPASWAVETPMEPDPPGLFPSD